MAKAGSMRQAAALAGVTPRAIRDWITAGRLPAAGPWTAAQLKKAAPTGPQAGNRGRVTAAHGTTTRWRAGCTCDECRDAHNIELRDRHRVERAHWWAPRLDPLCESLASGMQYGEALAVRGIALQAVSSYRRVDAEFAKAIDAALMEGRDPALPHGTSSGWGARCRCPECREYHEQYRR